MESCDGSVHLLLNVLFRYKELWVWSEERGQTFPRSSYIRLYTLNHTIQFTVAVWSRYETLVL